MSPIRSRFSYKYTHTGRGMKQKDQNAYVNRLHRIIIFHAWFMLKTKRRNVNPKQKYLNWVRRWKYFIWAPQNY
jgi:hypothetical protein